MIMKTISYISKLVLLKELVMSKEEEKEEEKIAKSIILQEIYEIDFNASKVKENGCVACHILFTLVSKMQISEQDASELLSDLANYGTDIILRKLLLSSISLQIAQNLGIDYHAASEELYYYIRKNEQNTNQHMIQFIDSFYGKIIRNNK